MFFTPKVLIAVLTASVLSAGCDSSTLGPATIVSTSGSLVNSTQILLTASNVILPVNTPVLITSSVVQNGAPVANGTVVTFTTNLGQWSDSSSPITVRGTTGGLAAASLTSPNVGVATVTVSANGTSQVITVVFTAPPGGVVVGM